MNIRTFWYILFLIIVWIPVFVLFITKDYDNGIIILFLSIFGTIIISSLWKTLIILEERGNKDV